MLRPLYVRSKQLVMYLGNLKTPIPNIKGAQVTGIVYKAKCKLGFFCVYWVRAKKQRS